VARSDAERETLRQTFDNAAELYERARPEYSEEMYDHLVAVTGLRPGQRLLEVGCGTGKATRGLARRGFRVTAVELGANLAAVARRVLAGLDGVEVVEARFEEWTPPAGERFDMVFAAASWHWIDPRTGYRRAWEALRPGGHLAFWSAVHVLPEDGDPFFRDIQRVYAQVGEVQPAGRTWAPGEPEELGAEAIQGSGLFDVVDTARFDWECVYDVEAYLDLLSTFSAHISMAPDRRATVEREVRAILEARPDRSVRRHWGAFLYVGRRRE